MRLRNLLTTTAAATTLALGGAAAQDQQQGEQETFDLVTWAQQDLYDGWTAEQLFATPVYGADGEDVGEVENLVISADGKLEKIIVEAGGFLDIGDTHFAVAWDEVEVEGALDALQIPVDEDNVANFSLFDEGPETGARAFRASELIDDYVTLEGGIGYGVVEDVVFDEEGNITALVVYPDVGYGTARPFGPYAYPYYGYDYGWEPGADRYELPYDENEIADLDPFDYENLEAPPPDDRMQSQGAE